MESARLRHRGVRRRVEQLAASLTVVVVALTIGAWEPVGDASPGSERHDVAKLSAAVPDLMAPARVHAVRVIPRPGRIALTFDDGPHPKWTPVVLDLLDAYGVKATFYVLGFKVEKYPEIAAEIVARGHSLQAHGWDHADMRRLSSAALRADLRRTMEAIMAVGGERPTCLRPPYGASSARVERVAHELGLEVVIWDVNSRDYASKSATATTRSVLRPLHSGDVVLMHDTWGSIHQRSLPPIFDGVRDMGIEFDTICDDRPLQGPLLVQPDQGNGPSRHGV